jgi:uncharacterized damage-inducible protein DinB
MIIMEIAPFLDYFNSVRGRTRRVIGCIPPERMEWSHQPGRWSFGDLVRHLGAIERWMFVENAQRMPSRYPGHGPQVANDYPSPLAYLDAMHEESLAILRTLTPDDLRAKCVTPGGTELAVWKWLRAMIEHEAHHRGQIHLMLSMIGVGAPPLYGLTEEEVRSRSA